MDLEEIKSPLTRSSHLSVETPSIDEIYKAIIYDLSIHEESGDDNLLRFIGENWGNQTLCEIEHFIRAIDGSETAGFIEKASTSTKKEFCETHLSKYYRMFNDFCGEYSSDKIFSPHVSLFFDTVANLYQKDLDIDATGQLTKAGFNKLVDKIREMSRTRKFKKALRDREKRCDENFISAWTYIEKLFEIYSRLLLLRIDLSFDFNLQKRQSPMSPIEAKAHLNKFLNAKRHNKIFKDVVGYIWKMEFGEIKGYHFHCLFLLDGSKAHKDAYRANEMGKYWTSITGGIGRFYNANQRKSDYKRVGVGIGMINHYDHQMKNNLMRVVRYFFKKDQFLKFKHSEHDRVFGRGGFPLTRKSTAGRPRGIN